MASHQSNMELRPLIIGMFASLLAGCSNGQPADASRPIIFSDTTKNFSVEIPKNATNKYLRKDKSAAFATYLAPTTDYQLSDYLIEIYPPESISTLSACSPSKLGISQINALPSTSGKAEWGKVDYWDKLVKGEPMDLDVICTNYGIPHIPYIYGFCSEKDKRTVVICVNEMQDNPELAKQIFETFRWTN